MTINEAKQIAASMTAREYDNLVNRIGKRIDKLVATFGPSSEQVQRIEARIMNLLPPDVYTINNRLPYSAIHLDRSLAKGINRTNTIPVGGNMSRTVQVQDDRAVTGFLMLEDWLKTHMNLTQQKKQLRQAFAPYMGKNSSKINYREMAKLYFDTTAGNALTEIIQYMYGFTDVSGSAAKVVEMGRLKRKKTQAEVVRMVQLAHDALDEVRAYNQESMVDALKQGQPYENSLKYFNSRYNERIEKFFWDTREYFNM